MMAAIEILRYLLVWGTIGAVLFSFFVIFVFRSGIAYTARNEDGLLKEIIPWLATWHRVDSLFWSFNSWSQQIISGFTRSAIKINFGGLYALNLFLYLILFLFDTLVIDGFVIGYWRPAFLRLPAAMGAESMQEHIKKSIPAGTLFGLIISLLCTAISYYSLHKQE